MSAIGPLGVYVYECLGNSTSVPGMPEDQIEPGELTERFRAFSESVDPEPSRALPVALLVAGGVTLVAVVVLLWLLLAS